MTKPNPVAELVSVDLSCRDAEFGAFCKESYREVLRRTIMSGATLHEAEDAVQEAMTAVHRGWVGIEAPLAYATRAAYNAFLREKKKQDLDLKRSQEFVRLSDSPGLGGARQIDQTLSMWEDAEELAQFLSILTPKQREVVRWIVDLYKPTEVAGILGIDPATVRQRLAAARLRLIAARDEQIKAERGGSERAKSKEGGKS